LDSNTAAEADSLPFSLIRLLNVLKRRPSHVNMATMGDICEDSGHTGDINQKEAEAGILPSHGNSLDVAGTSESGPPPRVHHL